MRTLAVDMDEPLVSYVDTLLAWHDKNYGTGLRREQVTQYDLRPLFGLDDAEARKRVFEFEDSAEFADVPATKGAREALQTLSRYYNLIVVTGRRQSIADLTRQQLERHYDGVFRAVYHAHGGGSSVTAEAGVQTKAQVCHAYGARVLIDDLLEHAEACAKEGITVLLMDAPWNQLKDGKKLPFLVNRVYDWPDVVKRLVVPQLVNSW
jgi:uncharacterized HAD superfamily protein